MTTTTEAAAVQTAVDAWRAKRGKGSSVVAVGDDLAAAAEALVAALGYSSDAPDTPAPLPGHCPRCGKRFLIPGRTVHECEGDVGQPVRPPRQDRPRPGQGRGRQI